MGKFICLLGIDGTGKTTQARRLVERFRSEGIPARYTWCRWQPFLMKPIQVLGRALLKRKSITKENYREFTRSKQAILKNPTRAGIWFTLSLFDYFLIQVLPKVVLGRFRTKILICDRYIHDTAIDQAINFGYGCDETAKLLRHPIARLFPKPTQLVLIDIEPETAFSRKDDVPDKEYLYDRRERYLSLAESVGAVIVDGSGSVDEVHEAVWAVVGKTREVVGSKRP